MPDKDTEKLHLGTRTDEELAALRDRIEKVLRQRSEPPEPEYVFEFEAKYWSATPHRPALARLVSRGRRLDRQYLDLEKRGKGTALVRVGKHYAAREGELIEEIECNKHGEKYHEISIVSAGERVGLWWDGSDTALAYFEQRALAYLNGKRDEFDEDLRQGLKRYQTDPHWQNSDFGPLMVRAIEHLLRAHGAAS